MANGLLLALPAPARTESCSSDAGVVMCGAAVSSHVHMVRAMIRDGHRGADLEHVEPSDLEGVSRLYGRLPPLPEAEPAVGTWVSARQLAERLEGHAVIGLSSFRGNPADMDEARLEARLVLDVLMRHDDPTPDDVNSGTYRFLFRTMAANERILMEFCEATVGPLRRYDARRRSELMKTLRVYLCESGCNMNTTAAATFTHRHTVAYRLARIRELTGLDPLRPADREQLGLGLKIQLILDATLAPGAPAESRLSEICRVAGHAVRSAVG